VTVNWTCQAQVDVYDVNTGVVQGPLLITALPATVTGTGAGNYPAGTGGRLNWKTSTLVGRRLLKGSLFMVPFAPTAYAGTGSITTAVASALNTAATTYLNALTSATLYPVIWHRPAKGATSGGLTGIVYAGVMSNTPASLRSRRR
jgi:hypothetical protein